MAQQFMGQKIYIIGATLWHNTEPHGMALT